MRQGVTACSEYWWFPFELTGGFSRKRRRHSGLLVGFLLAASLTALAAGQDKVAENKQDVASAPKGLRVFVCGHSLQWYIPTPLGELAKSAGIKDHQLVGEQRLGASKTQQQWDLPDGQNKAKQALKKGNVDVFVMSPIQFPDQGIENFVKLGLENNPNMRFTVQISWGGWDIDNQDFSMSRATNNVDRNKTPEQLQKQNERNIKAAEAQADDINKKYGKDGKKVIFLVPSAQGSFALRTKIYNKDMPGLTTQGELFRDTMSHPQPPLEALNTYMHFTVIYGRSPVGLPAPSLLKNANRPAWDEKFNRTLEELAWDTVSKYSYSGVTAPADKKGGAAAPDKKDSPKAQPDQKQPATPPAQPGGRPGNQPGGIGGFPPGGGFPGGGFPGGGFPGGGFPGGGAPNVGAATPTPVGSVLSQSVQVKLKLTDQQQSQVQDLQKVVDLTLKGILTEEQRKQLDELKK